MPGCHDKNHKITRVANLTDLHFCADREVIIDSVLKIGAMAGLGAIVKKVISKLPPGKKLLPAF